MRNFIRVQFLWTLLLLCSCASFEGPNNFPSEPTVKELKVDENLKEKFKDYGISPREHQLIPVHYLYSNPDQKGLLINHFVGTGKTYLSMFFTELYEKEKVVIIAPSYLRANWLDSLKRFPVKDIKRYEFFSYKEAPSQLKDRDLTKTLLIVDEAHNLAKYLTSYDEKIQSSYTDLYLNLKKAYKILALTATPIQKDESDLAYLINLVQKDNFIPLNKEKFRLNFTRVMKNRAFWRGHMSESLSLQNITGVVGVAKMLGFLTFIPSAIGVTGVLLPIINYVIYPLYDYKLRKFDPSKLRYYASESVSFSGYTGSGGHKDYPDQNISIKEILYTNEQHRLFFDFASKDLNSEQLRTFFPDLDYSDEKFEVLGSTLLEKYRNSINAGLEIGNLKLKDKDGKDIIPPKFLAIKEYLKPPLKKTVVYSLFAQNGIESFAKFLDDNGLKGQYEMLSSKQSTEEQRQIVARYNQNKNKILLLYPEIMEGVDLHETRQIHFLEPIANSSHFEQVKGRAVRYKSHAKLPEDERNVSVYVWKAMLDDTKEIFKGGSVKWLIGSPHRHKDFNKRHPELNYYSEYGAGKHQVDENSSFKTWSPDERATMKLEVLKESASNFYEMLSNNSIEKHYEDKSKIKIVIKILRSELKRKYRTRKNKSA